MTTVTRSFDTAAPESAREGAQLELSRHDEDPNLSDNERLASVISGGALLTFGLLRRSFPLAALGGYLAYRGNTGRCEVYRAMGVDSRIGDEGRRATFSRSITINRSREDVYRFFKAETPGFDILRSIERTPGDDGAGHWYVRPVESLPLRWEVELGEERPNESLAWRTPPESRVRLRSTVELKDAPRDRGTHVRVTMSWIVPGGGPGAAAGKALGTMSESQLDQALRRAKQYLETGEIATTEGQSSGRSRAQRIVEKVKEYTS